MSAEAPVKLYSRAAILAATFLGSPLSASWLMSANFKRCGEAAKARKILLFGVLFVTALFLFLMLVPEKIQSKIPGVVFMILQLVIVNAVYQTWQKQRAESLVQAGAAVPASLGKALLAGLAGLAALVVAFLTLAYAGAFPPFEGERFVYGPFEHEVYYKDVSLEDAQHVAQVLDEAGYFDFFDFSMYFQIQKEEGRLQIVLPFGDDAILKPQNQTYFKELKSTLLQDYNLDVDLILSYESLTDAQSVKI